MKIKAGSQHKLDGFPRTLPEEEQGRVKQQFGTIGRWILIS
jgi:hypothetical protein